MTVLEISAYYSVFGGVSYPRQYYNIYDTSIRGGSRVFVELGGVDLLSDLCTQLAYLRSYPPLSQVESI